MKLDATRLASALAVVTAGVYLICVALVSTTPMFYRGMMRSWMHGVDISGLPLGPMAPASWIYGLVTMTGFAWLVGYVFAAIYNGLGKK